MIWPFRHDHSCWLGSESNKTNKQNPRGSSLMESQNIRTPDKSALLKIFSLFLNQNICCGYSKELSQRDGSFEHPKFQKFKVPNKEKFRKFKVPNKDPVVSTDKHKDTAKTLSLPLCWGIKIPLFLVTRSTKPRSNFFFSLSYWNTCFSCILAHFSM